MAAFGPNRCYQPGPLFCIRTAAGCEQQDKTCSVTGCRMNLGKLILHQYCYTSCCCVSKYKLYTAGGPRTSNRARAAEGWKGALMSRLPYLIRAPPAAGVNGVLGAP